MLNLCLLATLLSACATARPDPAPVIKIQCASVTPISKAQQTKAADELGLLPQGSVIGTVIVPDWIEQRDKARACANRKTA